MRVPESGLPEHRLVFVPDDPGATAILMLSAMTIEGLGRKNRYCA